jgi:hypothetical protein
MKMSARPRGDTMALTKVTAGLAYCDACRDLAAAVPHGPSKTAKRRSGTEDDRGGNAWRPRHSGRETRPDDRLIRIRRAPDRHSSRSATAHRQKFFDVAAKHRLAHWHGIGRAAIKPMGYSPRRFIELLQATRTLNHRFC